MKTTVKTISAKKGVEKISMITAYDAMFASLADRAGADIILVGDSVGNTVLGYKSTVAVTMPMMLHHTSAVARGTENALRYYMEFSTEIECERNKKAVMNFIEKYGK